jgi:hypothetical protein
VDHRGVGPPWTGLYGQPEELIRAQPTDALGHGGLPRLQGEDEELTGVRFRSSPKAEGRRGDRMTAVAVLGYGEKRRGVWRGAVWNGVLEGSFL